jgi:NhaP-type Na+/H+ and K+/H+ antiporter
LRDSLRQKNTPQSLVNAVAMILILNLDTSYLNKLFDSDRDDHFTSDYFETIVIEDGEQHEDDIRKGHHLAKRICEQNGIEMYNATLGGELEVYDRVELRSVLDD